MRPSMPFAAMVLVWPSAAFASFNGPLHLSFGASVMIGVVAALPGATGVLLMEWKGATWTPPWWAGALAALVFAYCVLRLAGVVGPAGDRGRALLTIPPLIELALITFVPSPRTRHAAGWVVVAASVLLLGLMQTFSNALGPPGRPNAGWGLLCGGVLATALLWRLGVWLGQRILRRRYG